MLLVLLPMHKGTPQPKHPHPVFSPHRAHLSCFLILPKYLLSSTIRLPVVLSQFSAASNRFSLETCCPRVHLQGFAFIRRTLLDRLLEGSRANRFRNPSDGVFLMPWSINSNLNFYSGRLSFGLDSFMLRKALTTTGPYNSQSRNACHHRLLFDLCPPQEVRYCVP